MLAGAREKARAIGSTVSRAPRPEGLPSARPGSERRAVGERCGGPPSVGGRGGLEGLAPSSASSIQEPSPSEAERRCAAEADGEGGARGERPRMTSAWSGISMESLAESLKAGGRSEGEQKRTSRQP